MKTSRRRAALLGMLLSVSAHGGGDEPATGAALHAAHCSGCHDASIYTRQERIVNTPDELRARVRQCELMAGAGWFDEEVEAVLNYLDETYYRFGN